MVPSTSEFRDSLSALCVAEGDDMTSSSTDVNVSDRLVRSFPDGDEISEAAIVLRQAADAPISITSLVQKIGQELHARDHMYCTPNSASQRRLAESVLAFATALSKNSGDSIGIINSIIEAIAPSRVSQWVVILDLEHREGECRIGDFTYKKFEMDELLRRCDRAGSQLLEGDITLCRNKLTILRETRNVKTIDTNLVRLSRRPLPCDETLVYRIRDAYFRTLTVAEEERFLIDLDRQQDIYSALGIRTITADSLRKTRLSTRWITVFDRETRQSGWALINEPCTHVPIPQPKALSIGQRAAITALKLDAWGAKPLDSAIQRFCHYLSVSQVHETSGNLEESLLHAVFALDQLLGGDASDSLTRVLTERVAVLTHLALNRSQDEIRKLVRECYTMRSGYVHRGERGGLQAMSDRKQEITRVARVVLGAACFARSQPWAQSEDAIPSWRGRIDVLRVKNSANMPWDETEILALGLRQICLDSEQNLSISTNCDM